MAKLTENQLDVLIYVINCNDACAWMETAEGEVLGTKERREAVEELAGMGYLEIYDDSDKSGWFVSVVATEEKLIAIDWSSR